MTVIALTAYSPTVNPLWSAYDGCPMLLLSLWRVVLEGPCIEPGGGKLDPARFAGGGKFAGGGNDELNWSAGGAGAAGGGNELNCCGAAGGNASCGAGAGGGKAP